MDQKDIKINNLKSLLAEAQANENLSKLSEETSVDEPNGITLPKGVDDKDPAESNPTVTTDDVINTLDTAEDVEGLENDELTEEVSVDEPDGVKLPEGTLEREPEESNPTVTTDDVLNTLDTAEDVEGLENDELTEEVSVDEPDGVKLPEGTLEREPEASNPTVTTDDVLDTLDTAEDVEGLENDELTEEVSVDEPDGIKLPEGTLEREPDASNPTVTTDDVLDTLDTAKDVEGIENDKLTEAINRLNAEIMALYEEDSTDEPDGVKLPEGVKDNEPEASNPTVTTDDVLDTLDTAKDVEGLENDKLTEGASVDEPDGVKLPEGTKDTEPEESNPAVTTDDVLDTLDTAKDVEGLENDELTEDVANDNPGKDCCVDAEPKKGEIPNENTPGELTGIKTLDATNLDDYKKAEQCDENDYKTLKEAIALGASRFKTVEAQNRLKGQVAVLLAKENNDLLFEEYSRLASEAKAVREKIERKYSIISGNRVDSLLESMNAVEAQIAASKKDMFKKLHEQQEINEAVNNARTLTADELAFGE